MKFIYLVLCTSHHHYCFVAREDAVAVNNSMKG